MKKGRRKKEDSHDRKRCCFRVGWRSQARQADEGKCQTPKEETGKKGELTAGITPLRKYDLFCWSCLQ